MPCLAHISTGHFHRIQRGGEPLTPVEPKRGSPAVLLAQAKSQVPVILVGKGTARLTASAGENWASLDSRGIQGEETQHWHWQHAISPPPPSPHAATGLYFYCFRGSVLKRQERFCWRKIKLEFIFLFSLEKPLSFCTSIIHYLLFPPTTPYFLILTQLHTWSLEHRIHPSLGCTICFSTGDWKYPPQCTGKHTEILGMPNFHIFPIMGTKNRIWKNKKKKLPVDQE